MHRLKSIVRFRKNVLLLAVVYQLFRGTILTITASTTSGRVVASLPGDAAALLTAIVSACILALILLQLYLTESPVLLAPARIGKLLEAVALILAVGTTVRDAPPLAETQQTYGIFMILILADVILFAYLIVYRRRVTDHIAVSPRVAPIEDVEER